MTFQAVIDDSQDERGVFVLAGYIARAADWADFAQEWQRLLPLTHLGKSGKRRFKMSEMAQSADKRSHLPAFFRVIERYVFASISARISTADLRRIQARILVPGIEVDWGLYANPYYVTYRCLMDKFHAARPAMTEWIPQDEKIDFIFDGHRSERQIRAGWNDYIDGRADELRAFYGSCPTFEDDEDFLPLQAADFWARWVRKWCLDGTPEKIQKWEFDGFGTSGSKKFLRIEIEFDQNQLADSIMGALRNQIGPDKPIIDLRALDGFDGQPS